MTRERTTTAITISYPIAELELVKEMAREAFGREDRYGALLVGAMRRVLVSRGKLQPSDDRQLELVLEAPRGPTTPASLLAPPIPPPPPPAISSASDPLVLEVARCTAKRLILFALQRGIDIERLNEIVCGNPQHVDELAIACCKNAPATIARQRETGGPA